MDTDDRDVAAPAAAAPETVTDEVAATPPPAVPAKDEEPAVPAKDDVETDKPQEPAVTAKDHVETDTPQEQEPPVPAKDEPAAQASTGTATPGSGSGSSSAAVAKGPLPRTPFTPLVTVVGFHHARGPEVESWFGADEGADPAAKYGWGLLPFMALSDGAHASEEEFSYFTLLKPESAEGPATSLFGLSCTRQIDSTQLLNRPDDVTRSTVQKAVVVIADSPKSFGLMRQRLGIVTKAWFDQRDFTDVDILRRFQDSLAGDRSRSGVLEDEADRDQYIGMSLRELIHEFKWQTLVLLKCCLLQPKMLFFGSKCDRLCMVQFALLSLIPGLMRNLQDCADPELNSYEAGLTKPTSLQSSNRNSLLSFMGLPLQVFGKGSLFGPYTPLQQLDVLADFGTKSYIVGSTNSLLLQQKDRYSDILINLDEDSVSVTSASLRQALVLTPADRRWIDYLTQAVNETWDDADPSRPNNMQYTGSEEFIRSQFEAYILGLISSVKYHNYLLNGGADMYTTMSPNAAAAADLDPAIDYGLDWVDAWSRTENYRMWDANTDANLFAVSEPRHPCAGGLTLDDVQRRIAEGVKELHLDERLAASRDALGRSVAAGRDKASTMLSRIYSDVEYLRESQRRRAEDAAAANAATTSSSEKPKDDPSSRSSSPAAKPQQGQTAGARASAYMSSWASWAGEKRKTSGWGAGWGGGGAAKARASVEKEKEKEAKAEDASWSAGTPVPASPATSQSQSTTDVTGGTATHGQQPSFSESILSGVSDGSRPTTGHSSSGKEGAQS